MTDRLDIAILHPDLGIGGAEQLIINLGLSLDQKHKVTIFTPIFDPSYCFSACRDGLLNIHKVNTYIPKLNKLVAALAYLRMMITTLFVCLFIPKQDIYIVDQVSICVPILKLCNRKVIFYCHFPDKLLCTQRTTISKKVYRYFIDHIEEFSLRFADKVLMNSYFTMEISKQHYRSLDTTNQDVLYPAIELDKFDNRTKYTIDLDHKYFISLNRYERKKNIKLAINSFAIFINNLQKEENVKLVIAGGYDPQLKENVEHLQELKQMCIDKGIENKVVFMQNISDQERQVLLADSVAVLYTPHNEHFGIVPVEAMYSQTIVICDNSGGPKETVKDKETGYLINDQDTNQWAKTMAYIYANPHLKQRIGANARQRVVMLFGLKSFAEQANQFVQQVHQNQKHKQS